MARRNPIAGAKPRINDAITNAALAMGFDGPAPVAPGVPEPDAPPIADERAARRTRADVVDADARRAERVRAYTEGEQNGACLGAALVFSMLLFGRDTSAQVINELERRYGLDLVRKRFADFGLMLNTSNGVLIMPRDHEPTANSPTDIGGYKEASGWEQATPRPGPGPTLAEFDRLNDAERSQVWAALGGRVASPPQNGTTT